MSVTNKDVAGIFSEMADLTELQDGNAFRIRSFRRVAQVLEDLHESVTSLYESGALSDIPGVGKGTVRRVGQIIETGTCDDHRELREKMPAGLLDMLQISGMGPKTVKLVYERLGVSSVSAMLRVIT